MTAGELLDTLKRGEDSRHQFKRAVKNEAELAEDFVAFSNGDGGEIFVGVADDGSVTGLTPREIADLNKCIFDTAQFVRPAPHIQTETVETSDGFVVVIDVPSGVAQPYADKDGFFWVKTGAGKRKIMREELLRIFQNSRYIHADMTPVGNTSEKDINTLCFSEFYEREYGYQPPCDDGVGLFALLKTLNLVSGKELNVAGTLLFTHSPEKHLPSFFVLAMAFPGTEVSESTCLNRRVIQGNLASQFEQSIDFLNASSGNFITDFGIPLLVWKELVANALVHRDYFVSAPIRIFVFSDRIEILSPGHLPDTQTVTNIKDGNSNIRNPIIASFAAKMLPYKGLGSGILRALREYPHIDFIDDRDGNLFKAIIKRPDKEAASHD